MTFLIFKIFVYLLLALGVGLVAGWLIRNLQAQKSEESAQRAMHDAKAKLPQLESMIRSRDDKSTKLKKELDDTKNVAKQMQQELRQLEVKLRDAERDAKRWQQAADAKKTAGVDTLELDDTGEHADDQLIAELSQEITRLKSQVDQANRQAMQFRPDDDGLSQTELDALQLQFANARRELKSVANELKLERDRVVELERERELQNKSLQVLHQQLELERSRRTASGG
jgi:chromosome segregation ATPase